MRCRSPTKPLAGLKSRQAATSKDRSPRQMTARPNFEAKGLVAQIRLESRQRPFADPDEGG